MSTAIRRYVAEKEDFEYKVGYSAQELQAQKLRQSFFTKFIIDFDTNFYQTQQERDWAYIAKREYNFDVKYQSLLDGMFAGCLASMTRMFMAKKVAFWPLFAVWPVVTIIRKDQLYQKHNKKLFDMCNLGEQYYLGAQRNIILRECNRILDREDF